MSSRQIARSLILSLVMEYVGCIYCMILTEIVSRPVVVLHFLFCYGISGDTQYLYHVHAVSITQHAPRGNYATLKVPYTKGRPPPAFGAKSVSLANTHRHSLFTQHLAVQSNVTYPTTSGPGPCWINEYGITDTIFFMLDYYV